MKQKACVCDYHFNFENEEWEMGIQGTLGLEPLYLCLMSLAWGKCATCDCTCHYTERVYSLRLHLRSRAITARRLTLLHFICIDRIQRNVHVKWITLPRMTTLDHSRFISSASTRHTPPSSPTTLQTRDGVWQRFVASRACK